MKIILQLMLMIALACCVVPAHAQIPLLSSYSSAGATVYLDFDGQYVEGTIWNQQGPINADPAALSKNDITEIFNHIAEDYHPFNINITTDIAVYEKAPVSQRVRIIFTPTHDWYGNSSGASCVGSFTWGDDTPGWVFSNLLGNNPKYIAAAASHQIGHTLGLLHQSIYDANCGKLTEYNGGAGTQDNGWAPIMGIAYYKNCTVWQTGSSTAGCDSVQSDLDIIAGQRNHFGFRPDDYGNNCLKSESINICGQRFSIKGLINYATDKDVFRINIDSRSELQMRVVPNNIVDKKNAEADVRIILLDANARTVGRYESLKPLYMGIDIMLDSGSYYFIVERNNTQNFSKPFFYAMSGSLTSADHLKQFAWSNYVKNKYTSSVVQVSDNNEKFAGFIPDLSEMHIRTDAFEKVIKQ